MGRGGAKHTKNIRFSDAKAEEILAHIGAGSTQDVALEKAGVSRTTWYRHRRNNPAFNERVQSLLANGNNRPKWKEIREFACKIAKPEMIAVLKLLKDGHASTIREACKQAKVEVYQFHKYISDHPEFQGMLQAALATTYVDLIAVAYKAAKGELPGQDGPDMATLKWLIVNHSSQLPDEIPLPRFNDKQEITQNVKKEVVTQVKADIIDFDE